MAEGGGDSTFVVCVPLEITVDSETIGSAAIVEKDMIQNARTINPAITLLRSLSDITYGVSDASDMFLAVSTTPKLYACVT